MSHHTSSPNTQRSQRLPGRAWLGVTTLLAAGVLTVASCGQPTSRVEVGAAARAPETTSATGHTDHDGRTDGGGSAERPAAPVTVTVTGDGPMDGEHDDGHTTGPGFTEVPGGIVLDQPEHGNHGEDPCSKPVTPADYEAADKFIAETVAAMKKYHKVEAAKAAGYVQNAPPFGGEGAHYLNPDYMDDGEFINPDRVESLVYRGDTLEAAMYMMDNPEQPGIDVAGCLTPWHLHDNLCIADQFQIVSLTDYGDCPKGSKNELTPRMLHVWLIPHKDGPFAGIHT